jgi:hypothetical protein
MSEQQRLALVTGAAGDIGRELVLGLLGKGSGSLQSTAPPKVSPSSPKRLRSGSRAPIS